jgi:serine phosphatase RsbU (regulator of sigma subunit)
MRQTFRRAEVADHAFGFFPLEARICCNIPENMAQNPTEVWPQAADSSGASLLLVEGDERRAIALNKLPFTIGRRPENDLVLADPRVSREHARITKEGAEYWLADLGSKYGTFVNGRKLARHCLQPGDKLEFGVREGTHVLFGDSRPHATDDLLTKIGVLTTGSDLDKLSLLLEAARTLNSAGALSDVLHKLLELTLRLTHAERAYVFLREKGGQLRLAAGRDSHGKLLADDGAISRSILQEAASSGCEFLLTDTSRFTGADVRESIVAFDLRTVICIPLLGSKVTESAADGGGTEPAKDVRGVLYLDSHLASQELTGISDDVLRALAREAAQLVENAYLVKAGETARLYQQELEIAASIQQSLMSVIVPEVDFASVQARSVPCKEIGGDFFDVARTAAGLAVIVADVSGKGISAALLASTLQGLIYSQLVANVPLTQIASAANVFLCQKRVEAKYATLVLALLTPAGELEIVNCGHVLPLLVSRERAVQFVTGSNFPVGLFQEAAYESIRCQLTPGDRLLLYTDGLSEAANLQQEFFGDDRLKTAAGAAAPLDEIFAQVAGFCAGVPADDDCTVLELRFTGGYS